MKFLVFFLFALQIFGEQKENKKISLLVERQGREVREEYWKEVLVLPADGSRPYALETETLLETLKRLEGNPGFAWVGLSPLMRPRGDLFPANDPLVKDQWALTKNGINWIYDAGTDMSHVYVGWVDTGSCPEHEDISPLFWVWRYFKTIGEVTDTHGHGCSVSSVFGARANNASFISGLSDRANLISIEALDPLGPATNADIIRGLYAFLDKTREVKSSNPKARFVLNLSFGYPESVPPLNKAVQDLVEEGIIVVIAAGNDGIKLNRQSYTPSADGAIFVGAIDQDGSVPSWSNYGEGVDIYAPGVDILTLGMFQSISKGGDKIESKKFSGATYARGTSFAAPHVVGVVATILGKYPELSLSEIKQKILSTCKKLEKTPGCSLSWDAAK